MDLYDFLQDMKNILHGERGGVFLDNDELASVLLTYPACLIAAADGNVDEAERLFLLNISEELGEVDVSKSHEARLKSAERFRAFMWLLNERKKYDHKILNGIALFLKDNPESKVHIKNMMWGMAEASQGVSAVEKNEIARISKILSIEETIN